MEGAGAAVNKQLGLPEGKAAAPAKEEHTLVRVPLTQPLAVYVINKIFYTRKGRKRAKTSHRVLPEI